MRSERDSCHFHAGAGGSGLDAIGADCSWWFAPLESQINPVMTDKPRDSRETGERSSSSATAERSAQCIALGADHAGFALKETIRKHLEQAGYVIEDLGTWSEESVDYPDFGRAVGERVVARQSDVGIALCGTGIGISIAANKVPGIRAALCQDAETAKGARLWNRANVLCLSLRTTSEIVAREILVGCQA